MPRKREISNDQTKIKRYVPSWELDEQSWRVEAWIILRLVDERAVKQGQITAGCTTFAERRERIRGAIVAASLSDRPIGKVGKTNKREETFGSIFAKFYREPLVKT